MKHSEQLKNELIKTNLIPCFEIEVVNRKTGKPDYIIFDIEVNIEQNRLEATHESLNETETKSNKIAFEYIDIEEERSLDYHLQGLYESCFEAICSSTYFDLA